MLPVLTPAARLNGVQMESIPNYVYGISAVVFAVFGLVWLARSGEKMQKELARRLSEAKPAEAEILSVESAPMQRSHRARIAILAKIRVYPPDGEPYESIGPWEMDALRSVEYQPGRRVPVKIALDDPHTIFPGNSAIDFDLANYKMWAIEHLPKAS